MVSNNCSRGSCAGGAKKSDNSGGKLDSSEGASASSSNDSLLHEGAGALRQQIVSFHVNGLWQNFQEKCGSGMGLQERQCGFLVPSCGGRLSCDTVPNQPFEAEPVRTSKPYVFQGFELQWGTDNGGGVGALVCSSFGAQSIGKRKAWRDRHGFWQ